MKDKCKTTKNINENVVMSPLFTKYRIFLARIRGEKFVINGYVNILYVVKGKLDLELEGQVFNLKEQDTLIISPELSCQIKEKEENTIVVMQFEKRFISNFLDIDNSYIYRLTNQLCKDKLAYYLASLYDLSFKDNWEEEESDRQVKEMFSFLKKSCIKEELKKEGIKDNVEATIYDIARYIHRNQLRISKEDISLQDIAEKFDVNYYYLSRNFKKVLGINYTDLLLNLRTNKAINLILNTDKKISDICIESGFLNMKSINQSFQNLFDCSPSQVRKLYPDIKSAIKKSSLYQEEESQNFIRLKDKKLMYSSNFIKESININIDADKELGVSNNHLRSVIELNNIMDISEGLDNLELILSKMEIDRLIINLEVKNGKVYLLDKDFTGHHLSFFQANKFINLLNKKQFEVYLILNYSIPKTMIHYNKKFDESFREDLISKLRTISSLIGLEDLRNYNFALRVLNMKDKILEGKEDLVILSSEYIFDILDYVLGKNTYNKYLVLTDIHSKENLELYNTFFDDRFQMSGYILDIKYKSEDFSMVESVDYYLDLARDVSNKIKGNKDLILGFIYDISNLDLPDKYKRDYSYLYTINLFLKMRYHGFTIASINFYNKNKYLDCYIYSKLGTRTNNYYINQFNRKINSKVLALQDNYYITKDGQDITILLYDDQRAYYNYAKNYRYVDYGQIVNYTLRINNLKGRYKVVQLDVNHYNNNLVYKKLDEKYWQYLTTSEIEHLENTYNPKIDIDFLDVYDDYIFHFSRKVLKYKMIKLKRI